MADIFSFIPNRIAEFGRPARAASPFTGRIAESPGFFSTDPGYQGVGFGAGLSPTPLEPEEWTSFQSELFRSADSLKQVMDTRILASELTQRFIARNDDVLHGNPVIRGTRIPVYQILDCVAEGMSPEDIVREFPSIENPEAVTAAIEYASRLCRLNDDE